MPLYQLLTDRTLAQASAITPTTLIHIVYTGDPSQNIAGSSYKAELQQLSSIFSGGTDTLVTGGTYSAGTITFTNSSGGTFPVTGLTEPFTGGTVNGATNFTNGLTANTISASTLFVNGVQITGDTFVTGGTYSAGTITFTNNQNSQFPVTGLTEPFTGGSGNCIADLYVSNIHSCSPLNINPLDEGNVYFGSTSGVTVDVSNVRVGIGTDSPTELLHLKSTGAVRVKLEADTDILDETHNVQLLLSQDGGVSTAVFGITPDTNNNLVVGVNSNTTPNILFGTRNDGTSFVTTADTKMIITNVGNVGIGTTNPQFFIDIISGTSRAYFNTTSAGGLYVVSGSTNIPRFGTVISSYLTKPSASATIGMRTWNDTTWPGYGKVGDFFIRSSAESNGLNIIKADGVGTEDYVRFFAGRDSNGYISDMFIQGSGLTRGYVGIATEDPQEKLHVSGNTLISGTLNIGTIGGGTPLINLGLDVTGTVVTGTTGGGPFTGGTVTGNTVFTQGLSANTISATTYQNLPTDIRVTGSTYNNNTFTSTNNTGGTYSVLFNTVTGLTINGNLSVTGNTGLGTSSPSTKLQITANNNLTTANNVLRFEDTDTTILSTQMSGKIEFYTSESSGPGVRSYIAGITDSDGDGKIIFGTALGSATSLTGGTTTGEKMRIDENGYVGINENSPTYQFEVSSGTEVTDEIAAWIKNDNNKGVYIIPTAGGAGYNFNTISGDTVITTTQGEHLVVGAKDGAAFRFSGGSSSVNSGNTITTGNRIGIGTVFYDGVTQPSEALDINGSARFRAIGSTASAGALHYTANGTLTTNTSDQRLKENIEPLTNSLSNVLKLSGVTYNWIGIEGKRIGFIAQEVEKVIPELVFTNNNTEEKYKGIHQDNMVAVLVEAIKEQQKIIEELKVRISNLES